MLFVDLAGAEPEAPARGPSPEQGEETSGWAQGWAQGQSLAGALNKRAPPATVQVSGCRLPGECLQSA